MSVRRETKNRLTLFRECGSCGTVFVTTASSPFIRMITTADGHSKTTYYCSESCKNASYKHRFDGLAAERKKEYDRNRDVTEKNRRYYEKHRDEILSKKKEAYWNDPDAHREACAYQRKKRKLLAMEVSDATV